MGRNRELRKKMAARECRIREHFDKMDAERAKLDPDWGLVEHWKSEIETWQEEVKRLRRRLEKDW